MSRLAKKPIMLPEKVEAELKDGVIEVSGPLGKNVQPLNSIPKVKIDGNKIFVSREHDTRLDRMCQGLVWALIRNAIVGVTSGFKKVLEIRGVGYSGQVTGNELVLKLGFSHPAIFKIPEAVKIVVEQKGTIITISGINKQVVGQICSEIRKIKPPEPYKGTGIRYLGERVIKKAGKTAIGAGTVGGGAPAKK